MHVDLAESESILQIEMSVLYFCISENLMAVIQYQKKTP